MQFNDGARVFLPESQEVGRVKRVVIDPKTLEITHIIVHPGGSRDVEKVIPANLVIHSSEDEVHLRAIPGGWDALATFNEMDYRLINNQDLFLSAKLMEHSAPLMFIYPHEIPDTGILYPRPDLFDPFSSPNGRSTGGESYQNFTAGHLSLLPGWRVVSQDNVEMGYVERVILNPDNEQASCFVLKRGLLVKERKLVPLNWIEEVQEKEVRLGVKARFLDWLPDEIEP